MRFQIYILIYLLSLSVNSYSTSYVEWTFAERMQKSDGIAWGQVSLIGDTSIIEVVEVLKGNFSSQIILPYKYHGKINDQVAYFDIDRKVFHAPQVSSILSIKKDSDQYKILQMLKDPGLILQHDSLLSLADVIEFIGYSFRSFNVYSKSIPDISKTIYLKKYSHIPWGIKDEFTITCKLKDQKRDYVEVVSITPMLQENDYFRRLIKYWHLKRVQIHLNDSNQIMLVINTIDVQESGTMTRDIARQIIIKALQSDNEDLILAALDACARIRDLNILPSLIPFIDYVDKGRSSIFKPVLSKAVKYLDYSGDSRILEPILSRLDTIDVNIDNNRSKIGKLCSAIDDFNSPKVKLVLEHYALHNIEQAFYGLPRIGDKKTFGIIIKSFKNNPKYYSSACTALYKLVLRSNKNPKNWMDTNGKAINKETSIKWMEWWNNNKSDFELIKTYDEI